jgi:hypothetical protein
MHLLEATALDIWAIRATRNGTKTNSSTALLQHISCFLVFRF